MADILNHTTAHTQPQQTCFGHTAFVGSHASYTKSTHSHIKQSMEVNDETIQVLVNAGWTLIENEHTPAKHCTEN